MQRCTLAQKGKTNKQTLSKYYIKQTNMSQKHSFPLYSEICSIAGEKKTFSMKQFRIIYFKDTSY